MRWFGQGSEGLGEEQDNDQSVAFIVGHTTRGAHSTMQGAGRATAGMLAGQGGGAAAKNTGRIADPRGGGGGDGRAKRGNPGGEGKVK